MNSNLVDVACLNIRVNLDFLVDYWKVNPLLHDRITKQKSLRKGLESLFSQVPEV